MTSNEHVSTPRPAFTAIQVCHQHERGKAVWRGLETLPLAEMRLFSMHLVQAPANKLTPAAFVEQVKAMKIPNIQMEVLDEGALMRMKMNLLLATADGSVNRPRVLVLKYLPLQDQAPVALVGKGVCFDSGGLSLKPSKNMHEMKTDMSGAAICVATVMAAAKQSLKLNMIAVVGLVENMPSGSAYRPGDVITSMSGQTVEILDTDAEGRNVLADIMWYSAKFRPRRMITVATLTGAVIAALGHQWAAVYTKDDALSNELLAAAESSGDPLWRMPLSSRSMSAKLRSPVADLRHMVPNDGAGSIYAALFLSKFVHEDVGSWAHIDCAGTVYDKKTQMPTGWGPVLLNDWAVRFATSSDKH